MGSSELVRMNLCICFIKAVQGTILWLASFTHVDDFISNYNMMERKHIQGIEENRAVHSRLFQLKVALGNFLFCSSQMSQ